MTRKKRTTRKTQAATRANAKTTLTTPAGRVPDLTYTRSDGASWPVGDLQQRAAGDVFLIEAASTGALLDTRNERHPSIRLVE